MDHATVLRKKLDRLAAVFDLDGLATTPCGTAEISRYYRVCRHAYTRYSRGTGAIHLGLSRSDTFRPQDLAAQADIVGRHLPRGARKILELATGRGYNALRLARRHPGIEVHGIDLTPAQLAHARRDGHGVTNFLAAEGDFHDLSRFATGTLDLVFVVEALCHSADPACVLGEVARVLRPGGVFVIFDGYRGDAPPTPQTDRVMRLLARGMAVPDFAPYASFRARLTGRPFEIVAEEDLSAQTLPTLRRLEAGAAWFLARRWRARLMRALLPRPLVANAVSGYLFPVLAEIGAFRYRLTVVRRYHGLDC